MSWEGRAHTTLSMSEEVRRAGDTERVGGTVRNQKSALHCVEAGNVAIFQGHTAGTGSSSQALLCKERARSLAYNTGATLPR